MDLYRNLTVDEIKPILDDFFLKEKQGRIVKLIWFLKNQPEYTKSILQEVYGNISDYDNIDEFIYNLYYPECTKICEVCNKPLDGFDIRKGYYKSFNHKMCRKPYVYESFSSYHDIIGRSDFKSGAALKVLSKRLDVIPLLDQFKIDHPLFSHYSNFDILYLCVMLDELSNIENIVPKCLCGKFVRVEPIRQGYDTLQFSKTCYDSVCRYKKMTETLTDSYFNKTGFRNPSQNPEVKKKKSETFLKHYGNWEEMMNATLWGWCKKMGIENSSQLQSVKDKKLQTIKDKGYSGHGEYLKEVNETIYRNLGISNISQLDYVKQKKEENYFLKTGYRNPFQNPEIIQKIKDYWTNHPNEFREMYIKNSQTLKHSKEKINHFRKGYTGVYEFDVMNELEQVLNVKIYRQVSCMQYFIDGYIHDYRLAIEFDEPDQHGSEDQKKYDLVRQKEIQDYIKLAFVRISLIDWMLNKEECIDRVRKAIDICKNIKNQIEINFENLDNKRYRIRKVLT